VKPFTAHWASAVQAAAIRQGVNMFDTGYKVRKVGGSYQGEWVVVSVFRTLAGELRVVAESLVLPGLLHIFSPTQLELVHE
jgi:hypothetical protein